MPDLQWCKQRDIVLPVTSQRNVVNVQKDGAFDRKIVNPKFVLSCVLSLFRLRYPATRRMSEKVDNIRRPRRARRIIICIY